MFQERNFWSWEQDEESVVSIPGYVTMINSVTNDGNSDDTQQEMSAQIEQGMSTPTQSSNAGTSESSA